MVDIFYILSIEKKSRFWLRLAHTSLKSDLVPPWPPSKIKRKFFGRVVPFALFSFLFDQIFSEKVQNVANNLKIVWKKFGEHILDLLDKIPFFLKKILHFCINLEIIWKKSIFKNCILNLTIQKSCRFSVFIQRIIYWILLFDWFRKKNWSET